MHSRTTWTRDVQVVTVTYARCYPNIYECLYFVPGYNVPNIFLLDSNAVVMLSKRGGKAALPFPAHLLFLEPLAD